MQNKRSGFTLIELLIYLTIIAITSGIAFAALNSSSLTANGTRRVGDLKNIQGYVEIYHSRCDHYPGNADCSASTPANWDELGTILSSANIIDASRFPKDPVVSASYFYWPSADGSNYVLGAKLQTNSQSILKEGYSGADYSSTCDKAQLFYCIHS